jgi:Fe-S-cluster containining protein
MNRPRTSGSGDAANPAMDCRTGCGACCIAPSISSPIPGMPHGKPAGIPCVQLTDDYGCALFGRPERPQVCRHLRPQAAMCGAHRYEALDILSALEQQTRP